MATRTALRYVTRQGRKILQIREEGGWNDRPWIDVEEVEETEEEVTHREDREIRVRDGKQRK